MGMKVVSSIKFNGSYTMPGEPLPEGLTEDQLAALIESGAVIETKGKGKKAE